MKNILAKLSNRKEIMLNKIRIMINNNKSNFQIFWIILKNALPSILLMFLTGLYMFFDDVFSVHFANDSYGEEKTNYGFIYNSADMIRASLSIAITMFIAIEAIALFISIGTSVRYASLVQKEMEDEAKKLVSTSFKINMLISLLLIPIMLAVAKPWIEFQYSGDPYIQEKITKMAYQYIWIIIIAIPLFMFNQFMASLYRAQGYIMTALLVIGLPIGINLTLDYLFMGVADMDIQGGAWATFISYVVSSIMIFITLFLYRKKNENITNLISFKHINGQIILFAFLIGLAPLFRNLAQSFQETFEMHYIKKISVFVYSNDPTIMPFLYTSAIPLFNIFFPMLFGFVHGVAPIVAKLKHDKNYSRKIFWMILVQSLTFAILLVVISHFSIDGFFKLMMIKYTFFDMQDKIKHISLILMLSLPAYALFITTIVVTTGSEKYLLSAFTSLLRGFIFMVPMIILFAWWAKHSNVELNSNDQFYNEVNLARSEGIFSRQYIFWWSYPTINVASSFISSGLFFLSNNKKFDNWIKKINTNMKNKLFTKNKSN